MKPYVAIVGKSKSGKTTIIINVIKEMKKRGYRIATVKHHNHHDHFDTEGKDTYLHYQSGADKTLISSPSAYGIFSRVKNELSLEDLINKCDDVDLVIVEGYRLTSSNRIEIVRSSRSEDRICQDDEVMATITDVNLSSEKPMFGLNDYEKITDFIESHLILLNHKTNN